MARADTVIALARLAQQAQGLRLRLQGLAKGALADDQQARLGDAHHDLRPGVQERGVALLGFQPRHDPHEGAADGEAVLLGQRAAGLQLVVAGQVHAVVDELDRGTGATLPLDLGLDRTAHGDEAVHAGREGSDEIAVFRTAHPAGMDRRHDVWPGQTELADADRGPRAHDLRAVHVVVHDLRAAPAEVLDEAACHLFIRYLVQDRHGDARRRHAADRGSSVRLTTSTS